MLNEQGDFLCPEQRNASIPRFPAFEYFNYLKLINFFLILLTHEYGWGV